MGARSLTVAALIAFASLACGEHSPTKPSADTQPVPLGVVAASSDWTTSTLEAEGFNASLLAELNGRLRAGADGVIDSMLIPKRSRESGRAAVQAP